MRLHAEGDDAALPGGGGGQVERRVQRRRRRWMAASAAIIHSTCVGVRLRPPAGRRRRWRGRSCGPPAPARCGRRRCRRRASARRSGSGAPGCRRRSARRSPGRRRAARVSCSMERSETSGQSCLGKLSRDTGHRRRAGAAGQDHRDDGGGCTARCGGSRGHRILGAGQGCRLGLARVRAWAGRAGIGLRGGGCPGEGAGRGGPVGQYPGGVLTIAEPHDGPQTCQPRPAVDAGRGHGYPKNPALARDTPISCSLVLSLSVSTVWPLPLTWLARAVPIVLAP